VVGLDGATLDLIGPWVQQGKLPTLKKLVAEGCWGVLESTPFPHSAPAWVSCLTGVNPGKHGIFGFGVRLNGEYECQLANTSLVNAKTVPEILTEYGQRSIVINVPITYPPPEIKGLVVTGLETPGKESSFTFPPEFKTTLAQRFPDYVIEVPHHQYNLHEAAGKARFFADSLQSIEQRKSLALALLEEEPWDFFMVVFSELDRLQHFFWGYMDPRHPFYEQAEGKTFRNVILETYQLLDDSLAEILQVLHGSDTFLFIVSDHGFGPQSEVFYLNSWLLQHGYLSLAKTERWRKAWLWQWPLAQWVARTLRRVRLRRLNSSDWHRERVRKATPVKQMDWTKTRAFGDEYGVRINLKGREPEGVVKTGTEFQNLKAELTERLLQVRFAGSGQPVFTRILSREQVYTGPMLERAPDLVTFTEVGGVPLSLYPGRIFGPSGLCSGAHRREGIFMAYGPYVDHVELPPCSIYDLAPTVLSLLGVPRTPEMDGHVLALSNHTPLAEEAIAGTSFKGQERRDVFSDEESQGLEERLKGLGYL